MKKKQPGEFEELVLLAIAVLHEEAYGISIKKELEERLQRSVSIGALQTALKRLEDKGLITSTLGEPTKKRGGKRKRFYQISPAGMAVLEDIRDIRNKLWSSIPQIVLDLKHGYGRS